ncbi:hypothetical protein B0H11DRAFT_1994186 [Mycena galericulata]|nr:hypothetical protein B0H11DRAFT_1994186 [Mycena galericulata]
MRLPSLIAGFLFILSSGTQALDQAEFSVGRIQAKVSATNTPCVPHKMRTFCVRARCMEGRACETGFKLDPTSHQCCPPAKDRKPPLPSRDANDRCREE